MLEAFFGGIISFIILTLFTHPKSRINKKLPEKKYKNVQLFPRINFSAKNRVFHFHHWIFLTPVLLFLHNITHSDILNGAVLGGIIQGLLFKDRFKIISKKEDYHEQVKSSSMNVPLVGRVGKRIVPDAIRRKVV